MNGSKPATPTEWIDSDDAPELTDEFFERADEHLGHPLVRRGRSVAISPKLSVTVQVSRPCCDCEQHRQHWLSFCLDGSRETNETSISQVLMFFIPLMVTRASVLKTSNRIRSPGRFSSRW
ncbi:MAG: hypothetical protein ACKN9W_20140 [Methylococcus sp.]